MFSNLSKKINVNGNICDILDKCFKFLPKYEKWYLKEFDSKNNDCRDIIQKEKVEYF